MTEYNGYKVGEYVMCKLNNRSTLTVGKEYKIEDMYIDNSSKDLYLYIINDSGSENHYIYKRFMSKSEDRHHKINELLKK